MSKNSGWSFFINRRPISWLLVLTIIALGLVSLQSIPREIQPEVTIPYGSVTTVLPGASPADTESLITKPLEDGISGIQNIKSLTSSSGLGISSILVEFEASADLDQAIQDLKDSVDIAKINLPEDASDPQVFKAEANNLSIISFSITGERPKHELTEIAEIIQDELEKITGVSKVELLGGQEKQIKISVDQGKADNHGLGLEEIANALKFTNFNLPIGVISTDKINYSVRVDNRFQNIDEIQNTPILPDILVKDVANVTEVFAEQSVISKLSIEGREAMETISLQVFKKNGGNIIEVADLSRAKIEEIKTTLPDDIQISVSNDNSEFIRTDLGILVNSGIQTTILIVFILFLALGFKEGILSALSIPLSLLAAVIIMEAFGMTINSLTLFSLVIALGLMVDTAIVIMEGIHENIKKGHSAEESAIKSVETYKWALIAGTLTTVFAFFPMLLVSGIVGEFLKSLPITISAALLSSIFVSLTVIPSIAVKFLKSKDGNHKSILEPIFDRVGIIFEKLINKLVQKRFFRFLTILIALILFAGSMALPISGKLKVEMFPQTDAHYFLISVETPQGVVLDETSKIVADVEKYLYNIPEVKNFLTIIGSGQGLTPTDLVDVGGAAQSNLANITVNLVEKEEREKRSYEITEELRTKLEGFTNAKISVNEITEGPPSGAPITVRLTGPEIEGLKTISEEIKAIIEKVPQTQNIKTSFTPGINEFKFTLDKEIINRHGLAVSQVASKIRNAIQGIKATDVKFNGEDLEVIIKYDVPENNAIPHISVQNIQNLEIQSPLGYSITLGQLGEYDLSESLSAIAHEDQEKIISITSDITTDANVVKVTTAVETALQDYQLPPGYNLAFGGETEEIDESFRDLFQSMIIGIILIGATLVLMFNSLKQPFIILLTLPLALIGVFPGLMSIGLALSFPAFLGIVALSGVVVNDSIILIDRINKNRKAGQLGFRQSIAEAARARLQPIFMTSLTTIVGITPLALSNEFWAGLGFSLIFGLSFSTLLVLIVIPVLYFMLEARKARKLGESKTKPHFAAEY